MSYTKLVPLVVWVITAICITIYTSVNSKDNDIVENYFPYFILLIASSWLKSILVAVAYFTNNQLDLSLNVQMILLTIAYIITESIQISYGARKITNKEAKSNYVMTQVFNAGVIFIILFGILLWINLPSLHYHILFLIQLIISLFFIHLFVHTYMEIYSCA